MRCVCAQLSCGRQFRKTDTPGRSATRERLQRRLAIRGVEFSRQASVRARLSRVLRAYPTSRTAAGSYILRRRAITNNSQFAARRYIFVSSFPRGTPEPPIYCRGPLVYPLCASLPLSISLSSFSFSSPRLDTRVFLVTVNPLRIRLLMNDRVPNARHENN